MEEPELSWGDTEFGQWMGYNVDGVRVGYWRFVREESRTPICEGNFKNGLEEGVWIAHFRNDSRVKVIQHFRSGVLDGPFVQYDLDGHWRMVGQFRKGEESGLWLFRDPNGEISKRIHEDASKTGRDR